MGLTTYQVCQILKDSAKSRKLKDYFDSQLQYADDTKSVVDLSVVEFESLVDSNVFNDVLPVRTVASKMSGRVMQDGQLWNPLINRRWLPYQVLSHVSDALAYAQELRGGTVGDVCQDYCVGLATYLGLLWPTFFDSQYKYYTRSDSDAIYGRNSTALISFWEEKSNYSISDTDKLARDIGALGRMFGYPCGYRFIGIESRLNNRFKSVGPECWQYYHERDLWAINCIKGNQYSISLADRYCIAGLHVNGRRYTIEELMSCTPVIKDLPWSVYIQLYALTGFWGLIQEIKSNPDFMYGDFEGCNDVLLKCEKTIKLSKVWKGFITIPQLSGLNDVMLTCISKMLCTFMRKNISKLGDIRVACHGRHRSESLINRCISHLRNFDSFGYTTNWFNVDKKDFDISKYLQKNIHTDDVVIPGPGVIGPDMSSIRNDSRRTSDSSRDVEANNLIVHSDTDDRDVALGGSRCNRVLDREVRNVIQSLSSRYSKEDLKYILSQLQKYMNA